MKKLLSIALALVMALSLCVTTTWAAETVHEIASLEAAMTYIDTSTGKAVLQPGSYKLIGDVTIPATININGMVTIDLNDRVLNCASSIAGGVFMVNNGGSLILNDSSTTKTTRYFDVDTTNGLWTLTTETTANSVTGGIITGGNAGTDGNNIAGGVFVDAGGSFTMNGGTIVGCKAVLGAGGVHNAGTFTMGGGAIVGCTGGVMGAGGVYNKASFTMNGGTIKACKKPAGILSTTYVDSAISNAGSGNSTTMNANGGTVYGPVDNADATITSSGDGATVFYGDVQNREIGGYGATKATISGGTYMGTVTNGDGSVINKGTFYGEVSGTQPTGTPYTVTFNWNYDGATEPYMTVKLVGGVALEEPTDPTREGYTFGGWYKDAEEWDFDTDVTGDMTLTAKWTEIPTEQTPAETPAHSHTRRQPTTTTTVVTPDTTTKTDTVTSAKTFDAGIAVYGVMAALSLTGSAWVVGKKRD